MYAQKRDARAALLREQCDSDRALLSEAAAAAAGDASSECIAVLLRKEFLQSLELQQIIGGAHSAPFLSDTLSSENRTAIFLEVWNHYPGDIVRVNRNSSVRCCVLLGSTKDTDRIGSRKV